MCITVYKFVDKVVMCNSDHLLFIIISLDLHKLRQVAFILCNTFTKNVITIDLRELEHDTGECFKVIKCYLNFYTLLTFRAN